MPPPPARRWSLWFLAWSLLLCACGQDARSLNSQGERALRYRAFVDAQYFFQYAQERIDSDLARGRVASPPHPEQARTQAGRLALSAWTEPERLMPNLREALSNSPVAFGPEEFLLLVQQVQDARLLPEARLILQLARQADRSSPALEALAPSIEAEAAEALQLEPNWRPPDLEAFLAGTDFGRRSWPKKPPEFAPGVDPKTFR